MPASTSRTSAPADGVERVLLLPGDPDGSADALRAACSSASAWRSAVIINDSFGRAWRRGTAGVAIGAAGLPALIDLRGQPDLFGRTLEVSIIGFADEIAAAASLLHGPGDEAQPVVLVRGLDWSRADSAGRRAGAAGRGGSVPMSSGLVVALSGGIGGAKLALGLSRVLPPDDLLVVANTGDDFEHLGLSHLARHRHADVHARRPRQPGARLGPARRDLVVHGDARHARRRRPGSASAIAISAVHVERTRRLRAGETLSAITADFCRRLGVGSRVLPMSDDPVRTRLRTDEGWIDFQDYFVRQQCRAGRCASWSSTAPRGAPAARFPGRAERSATAGGGDLPVQSLHQHRDRDHRRASRRIAARSPGTARIGSMLMKGLDGQITTARQLPVAQRREELGLGPRLAAPSNASSRTDRPAALAHEIILEIDPALVASAPACAPDRRSSAARAARCRAAGRCRP